MACHHHNNKTAPTHQDWKCHYRNEARVRGQKAFSRQGLGARFAFVRGGARSGVCAHCTYPAGGTSVAPAGAHASGGDDTILATKERGEWQRHVRGIGAADSYIFSGRQSCPVQSVQNSSTNGFWPWASKRCSSSFLICLSQVQTAFHDCVDVAVGTAVGQQSERTLSSENEENSYVRIKRVSNLSGSTERGAR